MIFPPLLFSYKTLKQIFILFFPIPARIVKILEWPDIYFRVCYQMKKLTYTARLILMCLNKKKSSNCREALICWRKNLEILHHLEINYFDFKSRRIQNNHKNSLQYWQKRTFLQFSRRHKKVSTKSHENPSHPHHNTIKQKNVWKNCNTWGTESINLSSFIWTIKVNKLTVFLADKDIAKTFFLPKKPRGTF